MWDAVIIGGGPAGLTAGLYLSRGGFRTVLLEKETFGGPINNVEWVENYPGFADGVSGAHLASEMVTQATKYGLQLEQAEVLGISLYTSSKWTRCVNKEGFTSTVVIIAGGTCRKKLDVPGENEFTGKGVSYCATCDGYFFKDQPVAVVGGGNAAINEALHLAKLASKVVVIHRRDQLRATRILQERTFAEPKIEFLWNTTIEAIEGKDMVKNLRLNNVLTGEESSMDVSGIFVAIGSKPNTEYLNGIVPLDSSGRILVNERNETGVPYVLAAGDIRSGSSNQIITAAGDGAVAAISAQRLLEGLE